jgi:type II secretory ATPase GspE/PulE/Tfp pilus assembly ATPase PilB-like protein
MSIQAIRRKAIERGMVTLLDDAVAKVKEGVVGSDAIQEVLGCCDGDFQVQPAITQAA